jgi:rhodanese-related sulfurtransferase
MARSPPRSTCMAQRRFLCEWSGSVEYSGPRAALGEEDGVAKTVMQMVADAQATVPGIGPEEARRRSKEDPNTLIVDVRDAANRRASGMVEGAIAVSSGTLPFVADTEVPEEWRDPRLQDRSRPVITVCDLGPMSAMAAKTLKDMGFENVAYLDGGTQAWKDAGLPTQAPSDD